jgi:hypothetical protein
MGWWKNHGCETKKELESWIRTLSAVAPRVLTPDEFEWMIRILARHYHFEAKGGKTATSLEVRWVAPFGQKPSRCFFMIQPDGTEHEISWRIAVLPTGEPSGSFMQKQAMRCEVYDQIDQWISQNISSERVCGFCGEPITGESNVDHTPPQTFAAMVEVFREWAGYGGDVVDGDQIGVKVFADRTYAQKWKDFHAENARLRWAHKECNNKNNKTT